MSTLILCTFFVPIYTGDGEQCQHSPSPLSPISTCVLDSLSLIPSCSLHWMIVTPTDLYTILYTKVNHCHSYIPPCTPKWTIVTLIYHPVHQSEPLSALTYHPIHQCEPLSTLTYHPVHQREPLSTLTYHPVHQHEPLSALVYRPVHQREPVWTVTDLFRHQLSEGI